RNPRRVIRAVEVIRLTGKPFSSQRADWKHAAGGQPFFFGVTRSPEDFRARIDARVADMFRRGLVEETQQLLKRGLAENKTALQALGYRQAVEHLRGERSLAETMELVKVRTRQFAKRQLTWFRRQMALKWAVLEPTQTSSDAAEVIIREFRADEMA